MMRIEKKTSFKSTGILVVFLWLLISACDGSSCNVSTSKQTGEVIDKIENQTFVFKTFWSNGQSVFPGT